VLEFRKNVYAMYCEDLTEVKMRKTRIQSPQGAEKNQNPKPGRWGARRQCICYVLNIRVTLKKMGATIHQGFGGKLSSCFQCI
jgi:hypothetical protein